MLIKEFQETIFDFEGINHKVYERGSGPGVVIMHEIPGLTNECIELGKKVSDAGFSVFLPLLFGKPGDNSSLKFLFKLCISREFNLFAEKKESPITNWLRALCRKVHSSCYGPGVGVIGMCLTGNFAISLMANEEVIAPVVCQPALPMGFGLTKKEALAVDPKYLLRAKQRSAAGVPLLGFRFTNDWICPPQRFKRLRYEFGEAFQDVEIDSSKGNSDGIKSSAHSVLTLEFLDKEGHPTHQALKRVLKFLESQLMPKT